MTVRTKRDKGVASEGFIGRDRPGDFCSISHLAESGWIVQDKRSTNLSAGRGVAVREFPLKPGHGEADYLLFVDGAPFGVVEAKKLASLTTTVILTAEMAVTGHGTTHPRKPSKVGRACVSTTVLLSSPTAT